MKEKISHTVQAICTFCRRQYRARPFLFWGACAFLLPILCLCTVFLARGIILRGDASLFYARFDVSALAQLAQAKESMSFAELFFYGTLGFDPFLALGAVLPFSLTANAVLVALLRCGLLGLAFYVCAKSLHCKDFPALCGAVLYSLCAHAFVFSLYSGAATLLLFIPLCVWALVLLTKKRLAFPLCAFLSLAFLLDTRSGWLLMLSCIGIFLFLRFGMEQKGENLPFWRTGAEVLGAVVISFLVGFSGYFAAYSKIIAQPVNFQNTAYDVLHFLIKTLPAAYDGIHMESTPYLWCGLLPLLCLPCYFASANIKKREKIAYAICLGALSVSMLYALADVFFDMFGQLAILSYAQAALFVWLVLFACCRLLSVADAKESTTALYCAFGILVLLLMLSQYAAFTYYRNEYPAHLNTVWASLFVGGALTFACAAFLQAHSQSRKRIAAVVLLGCVCVEMVFGQAKLMKSFAREEGIVSRSEMNAYYKSFEAMQERIEDDFDDDLFRYEMLSAYENGISSLLGYETLACVSANEEYVKLLGKLGWHRESKTISYPSSGAAVDSLFAIACLAALEAEPKQPQAAEDEKEENKTVQKIKNIWRALFPKETSISSLKNIPFAPSALYEVAYTQGSERIYSNPYALPLLFACHEAVKTLDFYVPQENDLYYYTDDDDYGFADSALSYDDFLDTPVECLNALYAAITGKEDVSLFTPLSNPRIYRSNTNTKYFPDLGMTRYTCDDSENANIAFLTLSVTVDSPCTVLLTLPTFIGREAQIEVNGVPMGTVNFGNEADRSFINLGYREAGVLDVQILYGENVQGEFFLCDDAYFYTPDDDAFASLMENFNSGVVNCTKQTDRKIEMTMTAPAGQTTVFTTLPYSERTTVRVDGQITKTYAHLNGFLGFDLPSDGEHRITVTKKGENDKPFGAVLRPIGLSLLLGVCAYDVLMHTKTKKKDEEENTNA